MAFEKKDFDFSEYGAFFAFNEEQFKEGKKGKPDSDFVSLGMGLIGLKDNYKKMLKDMNNHSENEIKRRKKEETKEDIIKYELANFECYYNESIEDSVDVLKEYGYLREDIQKVFNDTKDEYNDIHG